MDLDIPPQERPAFAAVQAAFPNIPPEFCDILTEYLTALCECRRAIQQHDINKARYWFSEADAFTIMLISSAYIMLQIAGGDISRRFRQRYPSTDPVYIMRE